MRFAGLLLLGLIYPEAPRAQAPARAVYASPPITLAQIRSVRFSPEVLKLGSKLRVRNLSSGLSRVFELEFGQSGLPAAALAPLVASPQQQWLPEFSILGSSEAQTLPDPTGIPASLQTQKQIIDNRPRVSSSSELSWRVLGYRVLKSASGQLFLEVSDGLKTVFVSPEQAARRIELREQATLKKLFDLGWRSLSIQRYDLGQEAFERVLRSGTRLDEKSAAQAHLGLALSRYHREGCSKTLDAELLEADRDVANQDDVSYYRALCAMGDENYDEAEILFRKLADKSHPNYADASAFYLGVIAETDERYDDAETAYLDTLDFSSDATLAGIAKTRLENVRAIKAMEDLEARWISGGFSLGAGYDTNVVALPAELEPGAYGLSKQAALVSNDLVFASLAPPWSRFVSHKINYTFLLNKHFDPQIAKVYDSYLHDLGTQFVFGTSATTKHTLAYSWTSVRLGVLGRAKESLRSQTGSYTLRLLRGTDPNNPTSETQWSYRFNAIRPKLTPSAPENDLHANAHVVGVKFVQRKDFPHVHGPEASIEFRKAKGSENSLWDFRGAYSWDYYFGDLSSPWYVSQVGSFDYKPYYQSASSRNDYALAYSAALGRTWGASVDTRLQLSGLYNFSTLMREYQYRQAAASFVLTAFF
jgi:tetratricopeptide (TPR) repeat protein